MIDREQELRAANADLRTEIDKLRAELSREQRRHTSMVAYNDSLNAELAALKTQEPACHQYQSDDGTWRGFMDQRHYENTVRDGWTVRALYLAAGAQIVPDGVALVPIEPVAIRHSFDGYGWLYIDSGCGSNWRARAKEYPDAQMVYLAAAKEKP